MENKEIYTSIYEQTLGKTNAWDIPSFFFTSRVNKEFFNLFFTDFEGSTFHEQISGDMGM